MFKKLPKPSLSGLEKTAGICASIAISALIITKCAVAIRSSVMSTRPSKKNVIIAHVIKKEDEPADDNNQPEDSNPTNEEPEEVSPSGESSKSAPKKKTTPKK